MRSVPIQTLIQDDVDRERLGLGGVQGTVRQQIEPPGSDGQCLCSCWFENVGSELQNGQQCSSGSNVGTEGEQEAIIC